MDRHFNSEDVIKILRNKFVIIIGDSIHRSIYKDIVLLVQEDRYLTRDELKTKGEFTFLNDELIEGGKKGVLSNGVNYREVRQYKTKKHHIRFYFVTRCYNNYVKSLFWDLKEEHPDIVVMNSCLWDVSRYGKDAMTDYKKNILSLFEDFETFLPKDCIMIWNTTLPVSKYARGGFLPPAEEFQHSVLCANIEEANLYIKDTATNYNIWILDLYLHLWDHVELQVHDGIHWDMIAHRFITNLIMEIVCEYFGSHVPWRPVQLCLNNHTRKVNVERPFLLNSPLQHMFLNFTPLRHGRRSRANRRGQVLNFSQNSSGFQSPSSDNSFNDFPSPFAYQSSNNSSFQSPHFFQSPAAMQNLFSSQADMLYPNVPSSNFSNSPLSFNNPDYFQSSSVHNSPHYLDFENRKPIQNQNNFPRPNVIDNIRHLSNLASSVINGWQMRNQYIHSYQQPLGEVGNNGFFDLGQYAEQSQQSGAIRHNPRRRHQPYRGNRRQ